jgi:hypothetical protein
VQGVCACCLFGGVVVLAVTFDEARHLTEVATMSIRRHEVVDCCLHAGTVGAS